MQGHLSDNVKTQIAITATQGAAAQTDINGDEFDMKGYESIRVIVVFGTITAGAVTSIKWQQDTATGMGSAADLAGTAITVAADDDGKMFISDLIRPKERFVRVVVDRGTQNAVVEQAIYEAYGPSEVPVTQHADVDTLEKHVSPAEGTA